MIFFIVVWAFFSLNGCDNAGECRGDQEGKLFSDVYLSGVCSDNLMIGKIYCRIVNDKTEYEIRVKSVHYGIIHKIEQILEFEHVKGSLECSESKNRSHPLYHGQWVNETPVSLANVIPGFRF